MPICRELSRLPKAPTRLKSLNFKRTTPGSAAPLTTPHYLKGHDHEILDPTHPAARMPIGPRVKSLPLIRTSTFILRAFPKPLLLKPEVAYEYPFKPKTFQSLGREKDHRSKVSRKADMSLITVSFNKIIQLSVFMRIKIKRRVKTALILIATRGAKARTEVKSARGKVEQEVMCFDENDIGADKWILQGWTYVIVPTNAIFLYPWTKLIKDLRDALNSVNRQAQVLDSKWEKLLPKVTQGSISEGTSTLSTGVNELMVPPELYQQSSTDVSSSVTNSTPRSRDVPLGEVEQGSKTTLHSAASQPRRQRQQPDEERGKRTERARKTSSKLEDRVGTRQHEQLSEKTRPKSSSVQAKSNEEHRASVSSRTPQKKSR